jgi:hypothetical protein
MLHQISVDVGMNTKLGGDIQIQLALAMAANRKEEECISMFKHLEETHPVRAIQKQAGNLRFIMEAPKLEIGEDEKVQVPVLDLDSNKCESMLSLDCRHATSPTKSIFVCYSMCSNAIASVQAQGR